MADHVGLSILQFVDAWEILCVAAPGCARHSRPGVEYVFSGVPISFFNAAILTGSGVTSYALQTLGEKARAWAEDHCVPWLLIVTNETLAPGTDVVAALDASGYAPAMPLTGMLAQRVAPSAQMPESFDLQVADTDTACTAIMDVNAEAYAMSLAAANDIWGKADFWKHHVAVLGSAGAQPVSSAAVLKVSGHRYVALVATAPGQQRRGYADAAMRYALEVACQAYGDLPTFLHASDAGRPVYERMGYETVATHVAFMDKKFLGEH